MKSSTFGAAWTGIKSFPARGTWIEMLMGTFSAPAVWSFPARGTWIEMGASAVVDKKR